YALSLVYKERIYNHKIIKILEELSPKIRSTLPILHANKLYLLWGMNALSGSNIKGWNDHIDILRNSLNVHTAITQEFGDKSIFFNDGLPSLYMILHNLRELFVEKELDLYSKTILDRIKNS